MARGHLRFPVKTAAGNAVQNARVNLYRHGTLTPITGIWSLSSGGVAQILPLLTNAQGEIDVWLDTPARVDVVVDDFAGAAIDLNTGLPITFSSFTETIDVLPSPEELPTNFYNVKAFGAKGDGVTDDLPAFQAALAAMGGSAADPRGAVLFVPFTSSYYRLSAELRISRTITILGVTYGHRYGGSRLKFDAGVNGIVIDYPFTSLDGGRGDGSVIRFITLEAAAKTGSTHGIVMYGRAHIENCFIKGFSGNGIHIEANNPNSNANLWAISHVRVETCGGHGLYIDGADTNAGTAHHLDCSTNSGWGIFDSSFLGNLYTACHMSGNVLGPFKSDGGSNETLWLRMYTEGGQPGADPRSPSMVIGGTHGAGFATTSDAPYMSRISGRSFQVQNAIRAVNTKGAVAVEAALSLDDTTMTSLYFKDGNDASPWRLKFEGGGTIGWWDLIHANSAARAALGVAGTNAAAPAAPGDMRLPLGAFLGYNQDVKLTRQAAGVAKINNPAAATGAGLQFQERTDAAAPAADNAILYVRDNGAGKTQLVVRFPTGAIQVIATEP